MTRLAADQQEPGAFRNLVMVCIGLSSVFIAQTMLLLAVPLRAIELGATPLVVGLVLSMPYLLPLIFAIPLGGLVTRMGAQRIILIGAVGMMTGPWVSSYLANMTGLLLTQILVGISHLVILLAAQAVVASLGCGRVLERYFGWYTTCISGGQLIGPLIAGALIDNYDLSLVFGVIGVIPVVTIFSSTLLVGSARLGRKVKSELLGYRAQGTLLRSNVSVQMSILVTVSVLFALGAHASFLPVYLESLAFSATFIGFLLSLRAMAALLTRIGMTWIIQSLGGRSQTMIVSVGAVAMGIMWTGVTSNFIILGILAVIVGVASGISQPLSMVILAEHVSPGQRSSAFGMRLMANRGAQAVAPLLLGLMAELMGYKWTFVLAGVGLFVVLVMIMRLVPAFNQAERGA